MIKNRRAWNANEFSMLVHRYSSLYYLYFIAVIVVLFVITCIEMSKVGGLQFSRPVFDWESKDKLTELSQFKVDCEILFTGPNRSNLYSTIKVEISHCIISLVTYYSFRVERDPRIYLFVLFLMLFYSNLGLKETRSSHFSCIWIEIDPLSHQIERDPLYSFYSRLNL